jgi:hypothetical protein
MDTIVEEDKIYKSNPENREAYALLAKKNKALNKYLVSSFRKGLLTSRRLYIECLAKVVILKGFTLCVPAVSPVLRALRGASVNGG